MAQRAGLLFAAALLLATVFVLWLATAAAGGLAFKGPLEFNCGEHIPDGWYEATRIEAPWE